MNKNRPLLFKDAETKNPCFQMKFMEVKAVDGKLKIKGFASTPDLDRYDDIIQPTAFASAMATYMKNPRVLLGHDTDKPIGSVVEYSITDKGLEVVVEILNDVDGCMAKIENKTLTGFSIGWRCLDCIYKEENNKYIREVTNLDLAEISVVSIPANPSTLFTLAKSLKKMFDDMVASGVEIKKFEAEKKDADTGAEGGEPEKAEGGEDAGADAGKGDDAGAGTEAGGEPEKTDEEKKIETEKKE